MRRSKAIINISNSLRVYYILASLAKCKSHPRSIGESNLPRGFRSFRHSLSFCVEYNLSRLLHYSFAFLFFKRRFQKILFGKLKDCCAKICLMGVAFFNNNERFRKIKMSRICNLGVNFVVKII